MESEPVEPEIQIAEGPPRPRIGWLAKLGWLAWIVFCFELGSFLLVYPWTDSWPQNGIQDWFRLSGETWLNPYFRGAVSGLGLLNVYVSLVELFHYLKALLFE